VPSSRNKTAELLSPVHSIESLETLQDRILSTFHEKYGTSGLIKGIDNFTLLEESRIGGIITAIESSMVDELCEIFGGSLKLAGIPSRKISRFLDGISARYYGCCREFIDCLYSDREVR